MILFRFQEPLFAYTIAADSHTEAKAIIETSSKKDYWHTLEQWRSPDPWSRRALVNAKEAGIIDTVPRFVIDTDDGPQYVDVDTVYPGHRDDHALQWRNDSAIHCAWIEALAADYCGGEALRHHLALVVSEREPSRYALLARALAGALGLGPVAGWMADVLPALIALEIEALPLWTVPDDFYVVGKRDLKETLKRIRRVFADDKRHLAINYIMQQLCGLGAAHTRANVVMAMSVLGWLPPKTYGEAVMLTLPPS